MPQQKNVLGIIFFTVMLDLLGFGILIPVIPLLFTDPTSVSFVLSPQYSLQFGYILLGLLVAVYPLAQFFTTPILGQMSDRWGRKPVLISCLTGTAIGYVIFALGIMTRSITLLFLGRIIDGATGGNLSVAQATIADVTKPEDRSKNFGLVGAAFGIGFIAGPFIGGKLADPNLVSWFSASTPFWCAALLSVVNVLLVWLVLPETNLNKSLETGFKLDQSIKNIKRVIETPYLMPIFSTAFLFSAGFTFFTSFFGVFLVDRFQFTASHIGDFFAFVGIWIAISQAVVTRRVAKYFTEDQVLKVALFGVGLVTLCYLLPSEPWQLYLVVPFFAIMAGLCQSNIPGLISRSAKPDIQGEVLGINSSVQALAQTIPAVLAGFIAARITPIAPLIIAGFVMLSAWSIFNFSYHKEKNEEYH